MKQDHDLRGRQDRIFEAADVPPAVAHAMDCWAIWMRGGEVTRGYPRQSAGIASGGINCFDDLDEAAITVAAHAVDGVVRGFSPPQRDAIGVVFLGNASCYRLMDVDGMVIELLPVIHRGLMSRGVA